MEAQRGTLRVKGRVCCIAHTPQRTIHCTARNTVHVLALAECPPDILCSAKWPDPDSGRLPHRRHVHAERTDFNPPESRIGRFLKAASQGHDRVTGSFVSEVFLLQLTNMEHKMNCESTSSLESRVSLLERQNRKQRWMLLLLPLIAVALGAAAQSEILSAKKVVAEEFVLTDSKGNTRASLMLLGDGAHLVLQDSAGKARVRLAANPEDAGPALFLYTKNEKTALAAGQSKDNGIGFVDFLDDGNINGGVGGSAFKK